MAYSADGHRPVLPQRNTNEFTHPYKGVGTYSLWWLWSTTQLLQDMPREDHEPGTGRHPHGLMLSRKFRGLDDKEPLDGAGEGTRPVGTYRYRPLEYKGTTAQAVFGGTYGHADRVTSTSLYSNYIFDGVDSAEVFVDPGHARASFEPLIYKGVTAQALVGGQSLPEGYDNLGGHNRVQEWRGVASARALNI